MVMVDEAVTEFGGLWKDLLGHWMAGKAQLFLSTYKMLLVLALVTSL